MASRSTYRFANARGVTLLEVLLVVGLFSVLGGFALFVSMDQFRGSSFYTERDLVVGMLQHARALSVNNVCAGSSCQNGLPHGVRFDAGAFTLFQGASYSAVDPLNARFDANTAFTHGGTLSGGSVIFSQLSGTTSCSSCTFTLSDAAGHSSTITITADGQITWTR
jgi:Tfp pilus assembly protein FimT